MTVQRCTSFSASLLVIAALMPWPAAAQIANTPRPDASGDFVSSHLQGTRQKYHQLLWLVVAHDPDGLNCRLAADNEEAPVSLEYGPILESFVTNPAGDAIVIHSGKPWLNTTVKDSHKGRRQMASPITVHDRRPPSQRSKPLTCVVRANAAFIAPINMSSFREQQERGVSFIAVPR